MRKLTVRSELKLSGPKRLLTLIEASPKTPSDSSTHAEAWLRNLVMTSDFSLPINSCISTAGKQPPPRPTFRDVFSVTHQHVTLYNYLIASSLLSSLLTLSNSNLYPHGHQSHLSKASSYWIYPMLQTFPWSPLIFNFIRFILLSIVSLNFRQKKKKTKLVSFHC